MKRITTMSSEKHQKPLSQIFLMTSEKIQVLQPIQFGKRYLIVFLKIEKKNTTFYSETATCCKCFNCKKIHFSFVSVTFLKVFRLSVIECDIGEGSIFGVRKTWRFFPLNHTCLTLGICKFSLYFSITDQFVLRISRAFFKRLEIIFLSLIDMIIEIFL